MALSVHYFQSTRRFSHLSFLTLVTLVSAYFYLLYLAPTDFKCVDGILKLLLFLQYIFLVKYLIRSKSVKFYMLLLGIPQLSI